VAIRNAEPMRFTPRGLCDAFDATDKFPGACRSLVNLIFDQSNPELVVSRPGVVKIVDFALNGFSNPTFISIQATIGTRTYGMIATSRNAGHDEPFCYESATGAFITISGVTAGNTPTSPATTGDWTPPTLATVGTMIIITHPGFNGAGANFYGIIDLTNPAAPAWRDENTATNGLTGVPVSVANFNNRAYFAVGNQLQYTDVLTNPLTRTNATQALTIGDSTAVNALAGLPIQTTSSGVLQTLTVFKKTQIWQVSGDTVTSNLSLNYSSLNIGTTAPRSLAQGPYGLYFFSTGGPYFIDLLGTVRLVTNKLQELEPDIQTPFQNAVTPTRWAGAYNSSVYRVCGPTVIGGVQSVNDYWFDEHKRRWIGPQTFAYDCASALGGYFILSSVNNPGLLIQSSPNQAAGFPLTDLSTQMSFALESASFPKVGDMLQKQVAESQIELAATNGQVTYQIIAEDEVGNQIGTAAITVGTAVPKWGDPGLTWGMPGLLWTSPSAQQVPRTNPVPWSAPLVFEKMRLLISGSVTAAVGIGTFYARYQKTGYMTLGQA
jgi:hypothetical protein